MSTLILQLGLWITYYHEIMKQAHTNFNDENYISCEICMFLHGYVLMSL